MAKGINKVLRRELKKQKQLGPFLPDSAYDGNIIRKRTDSTLDGKGSFMNEDAWKRLDNIQKKQPKPVREQIKQGKQKTQDRMRSRRKAESSADNISYLNRLNPQATLPRSLTATAGTLYGSFRGGLSQEGAKGRVWKGTVQSAAAGAVGNGGLAYLQGEDPWEAAKEGAFKGAVAGAGYQGLKLATATNKKGIKNNIKSIGSGVSSTYKANTFKGNMAMRQQDGPGVSRQLQKILEQKSMHNQTKGIYGF